MYTVVICFKGARPSPVQSEFQHMDARQVVNAVFRSNSKSKWYLLPQCSVEVRSTA